MASANWADSTTALSGKSAKKPKKVIKEIVTRKAKSGGYIHTHHHTAPEHHPSEDHVSPDQDAMVQHMIQSMGSGGGAPSPDPSAAGADPNAGAAPAGPQAGPTQAPPPAIPGQ
jgi:hypothetical protein